MSGNRKGGLKAAKLNRQRHGKDFYNRIGKIGGETLTPRTHLRGFGSKKFKDFMLIDDEPFIDLDAPTFWERMRDKWL